MSVPGQRWDLILTTGTRQRWVARSIVDNPTQLGRALDQLVSRSRCSGQQERRPEQTFDWGTHIDAAVEAELKFGEVAVRLLGEVASVVD